MITGIPDLLLDGAQQIVLLRMLLIPHRQLHLPTGPRLPAQAQSLLDIKVWTYLVYLEYWTLSLRPSMMYPKVLFPLNFIIKG